MEPDQIIVLIRELAEAYAHAHTSHTLIGLTDHYGEQANLRARVEYWNSQIQQGWDKITAALNTAMPPTLYAWLDPQLAVTTPNPQQVEIRGRLGERVVSIRMTPAQATIAGAALIACAAAQTQQAGGRLPDLLPPMPPCPPGPPVGPEAPASST